MDYIKLINQFWRIRRTRGMTAYEADLYYYLLNECNSRMWLNPFELPTNLICAELGISRKTLADLRNRLNQRGLINFQEGNKNKSGAIYELMYVSQGNIQGNVLGNIDGNIQGNVLGNPIKNKLNINKTKEREEGTLSNFGNPILKKVEDLKTENLNTTWIESVSMNQHLTKTETQVYFVRFCDELIIKDETMKTSKDFRSHFVNWLKIEKNKKTNETTTKPAVYNG